MNENGQQQQQQQQSNDQKFFANVIHVQKILIV